MPKSNMTMSLCNGEIWIQTCAHTYRENTVRETESRDEGEAPTSPGVQKITSKPPDARERRGPDYLSQLSERTSPIP